MNLKFDVQRMEFDFHKRRLGATYRTRISWRAHERRLFDTHVHFLRPTLGRCGSRKRDNLLSESRIESPGALRWRLDHFESQTLKEEV